MQAVNARITAGFFAPAAEQRFRFPCGRGLKCLMQLRFCSWYSGFTFLVRGVLFIDFGLQMASIKLVP